MVPINSKNPPENKIILFFPKNKCWLYLLQGIQVAWTQHRVGIGDKAYKWGRNKKSMRGMMMMMMMMIMMTMMMCSRSPDQEGMPKL